MSAKTPLVVFTDLDGTLLDSRTYSAEPAREALGLLAARGVSIVFCSSKTAAEQRAIRAELGLVRAPFIVENGSAVIVPDEIRLPVTDWSPVAGEATERVHVLGINAFAVRTAIGRAAAASGTRVTGYSDLTVEDVAGLTGLDLEAAGRARARDYSETLVDQFSVEAWSAFEAALLVEGACGRHGGRFRTITGLAADKGRAVRILTDLYRAAVGRPILTAGLGDSANDESLLTAVDRPFLLPRPDGTPVPMEIRQLRRMKQPGPRGWKEAILEFLASA